MPAPTFRTILSAHGFTPLKSYVPMVQCMVNKTDDRYAEIYRETWGKWVWIVGKGIPSQPGYPGGRNVYEPAELATLLADGQSCNTR